MKVTRQQVAKNRHRIVEVAGKLFREKGFDGVSVADIMKSAGLTHGAFYGHFASKDDLASAYARPLHRDDLGGGCFLAALGADAVRQRGAVRRAFTEGIRSTVAMLSMIAPGGSNAAQREKAIATLAGLVGAVTLARAADDPTLSDEILDAALATFGGKSGAMATAVETRLWGPSHKKKRPHTVRSSS